MSGGFGIHVCGCLPRIIVAVLTVGAVIALIAGALFGAANLFTRSQGPPTTIHQRATATCLITVANHRPAETRR